MAQSQNSACSARDVRGQQVPNPSMDRPRQYRRTRSSTGGPRSPWSDVGPRLFMGRAPTWLRFVGWVEQTESLPERLTAEDAKGRGGGRDFCAADGAAETTFHSTIPCNSSLRSAAPSAVGHGSRGRRRGALPRNPTLSALAGRPAERGRPPAARSRQPGPGPPACLSPQARAVSPPSRSARPAGRASSGLTA